MEEHNLTNEQILAFSTALFQAERSQATSGNDRKVPEECTSVLTVFGRSARHEGYRYGLEEAPSERRKLFALHC